jgi:hypothetical protein
VIAEQHEHPAFPQPSDKNAVIWRYMEMDKFVFLVERQRLYMCRADLFGDDFEGTTPQAEVDAWQRAAKQAATEEERRIILADREQLSNLAREFRDNYYVNCWHMAPEENVAMWERYVKTDRSVAIKASYSTLRGQLNPDVVFLGMVSYIDYDAQMLPSPNMLHRIMHKRHFFADEREVRAVMCLLTPEHIRKLLVDPHMTPDGRAFLPPVDVQALIETVVLHPKASPDFKQAVAAMCATNGLALPVPSRMARKPSF